MPKITKTTIDKMVQHPSTEIYMWDTSLTGFGVRMQPSGNASFLVKYRALTGQARKMTPGPFRDRRDRRLRRADHLFKLALLVLVLSVQRRPHRPTAHPQAHTNFGTLPRAVTLHQPAQQRRKTRRVA